MAKVNATTDAHILVGIDISKNRHEVLIAVPGKTRRRRMTVLNMLKIGAVQVFHDPSVAGTCDIQELSKSYEMVARA